jgi:hypothetical protein
MKPRSLSDPCPPCPECSEPRAWEVLPGGGVNAYCVACGRRGAYDSVQPCLIDGKGQRVYLHEIVDVVRQVAPADEVMQELGISREQFDRGLDFLRLLVAREQG